MQVKKCTKARSLVFKIHTLQKIYQNKIGQHPFQLLSHGKVSEGRQEYFFSITQLNMDDIISLSHSDELTILLSIIEKKIKLFREIGEFL